MHGRLFLNTGAAIPVLEETTGQTMAQPYTMISALVENSDNAVIHVRVGRVWKSFNPSDRKKPLYTNAILLDEEGNHVWAMIRNNQRTTYMKALEEGEVFIISKVMVVSAPEKYRSVERDVCINFYHETHVQKTADTGVIPKYKFELQDFDKINGLIGDVRSFIDVIGWVVSYGDIHTTQRGATKLDVQLLNQRKETMTVSLWGDRGSEFLEKLRKAKDEPLFAVLTGLLAKNYFGELALSSGDGTKYFFNIDYPPLNDLKAAILDATHATLETLPTPKHKPLIKPGVPNIVEATVKKILEMKLAPGKEFVRCLCQAKIIGIVHDEGWSYTCCPSCNRGVTFVDGNYHCRECTSPPATVKQGYRVSVTVEDASGTTSFTLFNKDAEQLIGVPIEKLINEIEEVHRIDEIPTVVTNIVGKVCTFEVKVTSYNITYRAEGYGVTKVTECGIDPSTDTVDAEASTSSAKKRKTT